MIKNLFVNGCSFTAQSEQFLSWGQILANRLGLPPENYWNPGTGGAGNYFICNTTIDALNVAGYDPRETLVLVMWSGLSRKDLRVSREFYDLVKRERYQPMFGIECLPDSRYICSGGINGSWLHTNTLVEDLFKSHYLSSDVLTMCKDSLDQIQRLDHYLKCLGYNYRFLSIHDFWTKQDTLPVDSEFILEEVCKNVQQLENVDLENWLFTGPGREGYYEFAKSRGLLDTDNWHPASSAHLVFVEEFLIPNIRKIL